MDLRQDRKGFAALFSDQEGFDVGVIGGGPKTPSKQFYNGKAKATAPVGTSDQKFRTQMKICVPLSNQTGAHTGNMAVWANPFNEPLLITGAQVVVGGGANPGTPSHGPGGNGQTFTLNVGTANQSSKFTTHMSGNLITNYKYTTANLKTVQVASSGNGGTAVTTPQILNPYTSGANNINSVIAVTSTRALLTAVCTLYLDAVKLSNPTATN